MISLGGDIMLTTPLDPPLGSVLSPCLLGGRHGGTPGAGCIMWITTPAPPPGSGLLWKTSGGSAFERSLCYMFLAEKQEDRQIEDYLKYLILVLTFQNHDLFLEFFTGNLKSGKEKGSTLPNSALNGSCILLRTRRRRMILWDLFPL